MMEEENKRQEKRDAQIFSLFSAIMLPRDHPLNNPPENPQ